jgi:hypothetical protein
MVGADNNIALVCPNLVAHLDEEGGFSRSLTADDKISLATYSTLELVGLKTIETERGHFVFCAWIADAQRFKKSLGVDA